MIEAQSHDSVSWLNRRKVRGHVGLRAGVGLNVGVICSEQVFGALERETLGHVDELAAAVVAATGVSLGVFVGKDGPLRLENRAARIVLGRD